MVTSIVAIILLMCVRTSRVLCVSDTTLTLCLSSVRYRRVLRNSSSHRYRKLRTSRPFEKFLTHVEFSPSEACTSRRCLQRMSATSCTLRAHISPIVLQSTFENKPSRSYGGGKAKARPENSIARQLSLTSEKRGDHQHAYIPICLAIHSQFQCIIEERNCK